MDRAQKAETVESLKGVFAGAGVVVVGHYSGLTVAELTVLRSRLRSARRRAQSGEEPPGEDRPRRNAQGRRRTGLFTGPNGDRLFRGPDFGRQGRLSRTRRKRKSSSFSAGSWATSCSTPARREALATLPSLDELRGKIIGLLQAPATKIAGVSSARLRSWPACLNAYATKDAA
jgi:large subunit ribosomal protein L10